jgi:hypothetical protein
MRRRGTQRMHLAFNLTLMLTNQQQQQQQQLKQQQQIQQKGQWGSIRGLLAPPSSWHGGRRTLGS